MTNHRVILRVMNAEENGIDLHNSKMELNSKAEERATEEVTMFAQKQSTSE